MSRVARDPCPACGSTLTSAPRRRPLHGPLTEVYTACSACRSERRLRLTTDRADELRAGRAMIRARYMREIERDGRASERTERRLEAVGRELTRELQLAGLGDDGD